MGMSVKGEKGHRLVRLALSWLLVSNQERAIVPALTEEEQQELAILIRRADLGLERAKKKRKQRRAVHVAHMAAMPKSPEGW